VWVSECEWVSEDGKDGKEEARIQNKTKTPHVNVGKNNLQDEKPCLHCDMALQSSLRAQRYVQMFPAGCVWKGFGQEMRMGQNRIDTYR
jgi:hypothetical protein